MVGSTNVNFGRSTAISRRLRRAAEVAMGEVLGAKKGERVLIITNPGGDVQQISLALYDAAIDAGAAPTVLFQPAKTQLDFAEDSVIHALRSSPDIAISVSSGKLGKDRFAMRKNYKYRGKSLNHIFDYLLVSKKARSFWSPSVTVEMFERTVPVDYAKLRRSCATLKKAFDTAGKVRITSKKGTDLVLGLRGRKAFTDDGNSSKPGAGGNLPAGEMFISPELGAGEGTVIYDGCISSDKGVILIKTQVRVTVKNNLVTNITGGREASLLRATLGRAETATRHFAKEGRITRADLTDYLRNIYNLGELGIGLNEKARIVGNMLEDEKVFRTCHIAIGSNYDEDAKALIHLDGLVRNPTIELIYKGGRSKRVMEDGDLLI